MQVDQKPWLSSYPEPVSKSVETPEQPLPYFLEKSAKEFPDREAVHFMGKRITYRQLLDEVYRMARALKSIGVQRGERVSIMMPNSPQSVIAYYAVLMIGGIVVNTNPMY
ncbi:long-chain fatty acid--CoA ligase, partial [Klebsiella pneumoniae]